MIQKLDDVTLFVNNYWILEQPIDELFVEKICNRFFYLGLFSVKDIFVTIIKKINNIDTEIDDELFEEARLPLNQFFLENKIIFQFKGNNKENEEFQMRLPIEALGFDIRIYNALRRKHISTVNDLFISIISQKSIRNVGEASWSIINKKIKDFLNSDRLPNNKQIYFNENKDDDKINGAYSFRVLQVLESKNILIESQSATNLTFQIAKLRVIDRHWEILFLRSQGFTLQEIADENGVSRERIRQIIVSIRSKIKYRYQTLLSVFDFLEKNFNNAWEPFSKSITLEKSIEIITKVFLSSGWSGSNFENIKRIVTIIRYSPNIHDNTFPQRWPKILMAICSIDPPVICNLQVAEIIEENEISKKQWSYKQLSIYILKQNGNSLHWHEIAEKAIKLKKRNNFDYQGIYNALLRDKIIFVRVDQGTYGLREWGLQPSEYYTDLLAKYLKDEKIPRTFGGIFNYINIIKAIKKSSLLMLLNLNPRFYKSIENTYGLRAWLQPRVKQTLLTPKAFVEDLKSFTRVSRAIDNGYDVDKIISMDK